MSKDARSSSGQGFVVRRDRLLTDLATRGRSAGISIVCAPGGLGKTGLLTQYVAEVRNDPARGVARLLKADELGIEQLVRKLRMLRDDLEPKMHPLVAIDDLPVLGEDSITVCADLFRELRSAGIEVVVACRPNNRALVKALGDSHKVGAQALKVQPGEYADWVSAFSISTSLDVYELTQGIPALIPLLRSATRRKSGNDSLTEGAVDLYRSVLEDARRERDPLYRLMCLFILMGTGSLTDFERCGMRIRSDTLSRLARDYPVFGFDSETQRFACLVTEGTECDALRKEIAERRPAFALKAVRILASTGQVDHAVHLAGLTLDAKGCIEAIGCNPVEFALSGNALFVHATVSRLTGADSVSLSVNVILAMYLASLVMGEYRMARAMCGELRRRANEIEHDVAREAWSVAVALSELWGDCSGVELPHLSQEFTHGILPEEAQLLRAHRVIYRKLIGGDGNPEASLFPTGPIMEAEGTDRISLSRLLLECDRVLDAALHGELGDAAETDARLQDMVEELVQRRLAPIAARMRMTAATCRVLSGLPLVDERAFSDAGTVAVRESDFATQLFCLLGEGWQSLDVGQVVNARFRAQQVLKLAEPEHGFLRSWATVLDRAAFINNTSRVGICDEAEMIDLSEDARTPAEAWSVALQLSAARYDSELSAWYSIHKTIMLDTRFCPIARLAMAAIGDRANGVRRLLPSRLFGKYCMGTEEPRDAHALFEAETIADAATVLGQVNVNLFGGFIVQRNGHTLTSGIWKRKKASVLTARLVLAMGTFVSRQVITEEMWPDLEYPRARENLYSAISSLRSAFGQQNSGPQYLLTQGDGLALNAEYITSDVGRFDMLAREILLKRTGASGRQIVESCLKIEQIYTGALYVPDFGDTTFFQRMRRAYLSKFIDCMLRGIEVAIEIDDMPSASWLVEAALRHAPMREDVIRCAMRIYDLSGRRREVVELYQSHVHMLERELKAIPEEETRLAYEAIIDKSSLSEML